MNRELTADVLVIGGGTAGFGAALASGRAGLQVRLIEAGSKIGGVMAFCPGMPWGAGLPVGRSIGGIFGELTARLSAMEPPAAELRPSVLENFGIEVIYDHETAVFTMFQMLEDAGVDVHLGTIATSPVMDGARIAAVECTDRRGPFTIRAAMVIDCSGDGDIAAKAGVPYTLGDAQGNMMGVTLSFMMTGADWAQVFAHDDPYFRREAAEGIAAGRLHPDLAKLYLMRGLHPGSVFCNSVHIRGVDGTDPGQVSRATQEGRRRCHQLADFLRQSVPGFEQARMSDLGPTVGVRETRRLEALYRITADDLAGATKFADGVVACDNPIDDVMRGQGAMIHDAIVGPGDYYTIPFRALVPRKLENLLFAGRLVCADPVAFASVRGMPQCMAMGQAVGTAAAQALAQAVPVQALDLPGLITALGAQGMNGIGGASLI
ncbi:FAD-dependent oxidoreductase [Novosphingobium sp. B 225]|uniref:FAD-dependent oxidoreductase n=1 Tax=Novosphingobium sp. B 225 TaxID=1961849 RepID=UPI000B4BE481|nr:FAD-dependent oxidoreductase [Novosphingobium sp. B 225]